MTKKRRLIKRKTKKKILELVKNFFVMLLIFSLTYSFAFLIVQNMILKEDNTEIVYRYEKYKELYEDVNSQFVTEYNYWLKNYQSLREDYIELSKYITEEELNYEIFTVTGYSANDRQQGTTNITSIGFKLNAQYMDYINICAVDPEVIPYGSIVLIRADWEGDGFIYEKVFIAGDTGGAIVGKRIDIYFDTKTRAEMFGVQGCPVRVIRRENKNNL